MRDTAGMGGEALGKEVAKGGVRSVSGGDINDAYLVALEDGQKVFLKVNTPGNAAFFSAEQAGLEALRKTDAIGVPKAITAGVSRDCSFLIMEYLEAGPHRPDYWERFGRQLAAMHKAETGEWTPQGKYGFTQNNFIGAGRQNNHICGSWIDFFREYRLEQQFRWAEAYFDSYGRKAMQSLLDHLEDYLVEPEFPSLLHGDLWGGNFVTGPDGSAWLIDPAVYVGHAEADLAMTELFGGFAPAFYGAYKEMSPLLPGYADRRELYNLYHLLNHLNLFGEAYYGSVMRIVRRYGRRPAG